MKSHVVLIPGAWHSGDAYDLLVPLLRVHGHETTSLTLPSVGAEPPLTSLEPEVEYIRNTVEPLSEQGKEIVVVMHSYGGFAGSAALHGLSRAERHEKGLNGGIVALVYLAAWMLDEGQSISGSGGGKGGKGGPSTIKVEVLLEFWRLLFKAYISRVTTSTISTPFQRCIMTLIPS